MLYHEPPIKHCNQRQQYRVYYEFFKNIQKNEREQLHYHLNTAIKYNHIKIVLLFLQHNVPLCLGQEFHPISLHCAVEKANNDIITLLLNYGTDINIISRDDLL